MVETSLGSRKTTEAHESADGPDFLCIGMGKSGTGWLYDQLLAHPDFWMPPIKELHYLNREEPKVRARGYLSRKRVDGEIKRGRGRPSLREKEIQFLEKVHAARGQRMSLEFYASIFCFKDNLLSGDVTPSYCAMPEDLIAKIMARFPKLKIIMLVRDPVSRAFSHLSMMSRGDKVSVEQLQDVDKFREYFKEARVARTGMPATFAKRWLKHAPDGQFRHYFFEDLQSDPGDVRRQILEYLGADSNKEIAIDPTENRKIKPKAEFGKEVTAFLIEQFSDELLACADVFGGHAKDWPARYGISRT